MKKWRLENQLRYWSIGKGGNKMHLRKWLDASKAQLEAINLLFRIIIIENLRQKKPRY